jgi:hypothetical protein
MPLRVRWDDRTGGNRWDGWDWRHSEPHQAAGVSGPAGSLDNLNMPQLEKARQAAPGSKWIKPLHAARIRMRWHGEPHQTAESIMISARQPGPHQVWRFGSRSDVLVRRATASSGLSRQLQAGPTRFRDSDQPTWRLSRPDLCCLRAGVGRCRVKRPGRAGLRLAAGLQITGTVLRLENYKSGAGGRLLRAHGQSGPGEGIRQRAGVRVKSRAVASRRHEVESQCTSSSFSSALQVPQP